MLRLDWNLLFTVINLLLLFVLMKIFLFKPVQKIIAARQAEADKQFDEAAAKQAEASHPESAAAPESGDRFDQLEQMVNHKKRTEPQPAPAAKPIKPVVVETPAPRSRLKRILDFFKLRR